MLTACGYSVLVPENALEVLPLCEQHKGMIHLLVTDVIMPDMNGRELARRLVDNRPTIRVLYMSGYTDTALISDGLDASALFLEKPFTPASLTSKVREALDHTH